MSDFISVIVPIHKEQKNFSMVRQRLLLATQIEIIYVVSEELSNDIIADRKSNEQIIRIKNFGRGQMISGGIHHAKGDIIMFLHSDTILPKDWDVTVRHTLLDKKVIGGGFSLKFDIKKSYLGLSLRLVEAFVKIRKIFSGDRAVFFRSQPFINDMPNLEIPIMEDIELSFWMKKHGKVVLLKESVLTSADAFVKNGLIRQSWKIVKSMLWYKFGGDPWKIYSYYYS